MEPVGTLSPGVFFHARPGLLGPSERWGGRECPRVGGPEGPVWYWVRWPSVGRAGAAREGCDWARRP